MTDLLTRQSSSEHAGPRVLLPCGAWVTDAVDQARADAQGSIQQNNPAGADQADQAVEAAKAIVASGVVGGPGATVAASLSGHGNPGHVPAPNWANDTTAVSVYQVTNP